MRGADYPGNRQKLAKIRELASQAEAMTYDHMMTPEETGVALATLAGLIIALAQVVES